MSRILVVEDDELNREIVAQYLRADGFEVTEARDGMSAIKLARTSPDAMILDLGLPAIDGLNVLRTLRRTHIWLPVIVLSARVDEVDRIVAFEAGADDYVPKPFLPREIPFRVRALLRRSGESKPSAGTVRRFGRIEIDEAAREFRVDGEVIDMRPREFELLRVLAAQPGIALARSALIEKAWGSDYDGDERTVDGHVRRIRQKLEARGSGVSCIATIHGFGYKFLAA